MVCSLILHSTVLMRYWIVLLLPALTGSQPAAIIPADVGEEGILSQLSHLEELPQLIQTGTNESADEAKEYKVIEKNGVKIGLLSYTYGLNGFALPDGKEYLVNLIDEDRIREDMKALNQISDVQVVTVCPLGRGISV